MTVAGLWAKATADFNKENQKRNIRNNATKASSKRKTGSRRSMRLDRVIRNVAGRRKAGEEWQKMGPATLYLLRKAVALDYVSKNAG